MQSRLAHSSYRSTGTHRPRWCLLFVVLVLLCMSTRTGWAQALSGISGTVTDSTGAIVPGANVTVTNEQTKVPSRTVTTSSGSYRVTDLVPGTYDVRVEVREFSPYVVNGVHIDVGTVATANATLQAGGSNETVEVNAPAISLETTQPMLGTTIENKLVQELPVEIGGRDRQIDNFMFLAPGVSGGTFSHRIDGGVDFSNEVVFNGVPAVQSETAGYQTNINPPFELVGQFQVMQNVFPAQYGLGQGVAQYQFASGTNALHGDAFEVLRNNFFDAKGGNPQLNAAGLPVVANDKENNWGFSLGGPVILPKLYNGKDKTFFYVSSDWFRQNNGITGNLTVPTQAMINGDFSGFPQTIYVPSSGLIAGCNPGAAPGQPFPGNIIPQNCISSVSKSLLGYVPTPTSPGYVNNLASQVTAALTTQTNWGFNIDERFTSKQSAHVSFWRDSHQGQAYDHGGYFTGPLSALKLEPTLGTGIFVTYTNALTPHLIVTGGLGWLGEINNELNAHIGTSFAAAAGSEILPTINFGGFDAPTAWGVNGGGEINSTNRKLGVGIVNNWLYTRGRQTFNWGFEIRRAYQDDNECQNCGGQFTFSALTTSNGIQGSTGLTQDNTGSSFASYLLGVVDSSNRTLAAENKLRNFYIAPYVQDDIKITPKLTLNAGIRWDIARPFTNATPNNIVFFDPNAANATAINPATGAARLGGASVLGTCSYCSGYNRANIDWRMFSPRLGFAYQVSNKMVVLGGFSLNHLDGGPFEFGTNKVAVNYGNYLSGLFNVPTTNTNVAAYGNWDTRTMPLPAPTAFTSGLLNGQNIDTFAQNAGGLPYIENFNIGFQREVPGNVLVSVNYVGNHALHQPSREDNPNQLTPATLQTLCPGGNANCVLGQAWTSAPAQAVLKAAGFGMSGGYYTPYANFINDYGNAKQLGQALRPLPQYQTVVNNFENEGTTEYNALQFQAQKRFSNGLTYLVSYTLAKTMSNTDSGFGTFNAGSLNTYNQQADWAIASNDQTHQINISGVYELPIGPGKPLLHDTGTVNRLVTGGWQLSGTFQYGSGTPFTIAGPGCPLQGFYYCNRANVVPGQRFNLDYNNYYKHLPVVNTNAFSNPGPWTLGNAARNISTLRGTWGQNENVALAKHLNFTERFSGEVRMEYYDILNRMQVCGGFDNSITSGTFGLDSPGGKCQGNTPRQGQATFKLQF